ncbi:cytochrome P450 [Chitinophaga solisilvae]|uniref:cytochrome P450 n=1 Tax=Chitinophaga solisilvae TaxID=1233460 RepID=UPI001367E1DF|nr:cytochrome P450 [Chitinophaga solisilvae]
MVNHNINFFSKPYQDNPYRYYQEMHEQYPLFFHEPTNSYVISSYEDVERALKDPVFSSRNYSWQVEPLNGVTILQMEGKEHTQYRNTVASNFHRQDLVEQTLPLIRKNVASLFDAFKGRKVIDLRKEFTALLPLRVIIDMLGLPEKDLPVFQFWYHAFARFLQNINGSETVIQEGKAAMDAFRDYVDNIVDERTENPGNDLISVLCSAQMEGKRMSKERIVGYCALLLHGGGETTDKAIASLFRNLLLHPDQLALLKQDRSLLDAAITESLRYSPPAHMILRTTNEKVKVSGGEIPENATVVCMLGAANRDRRRFKNPDEFNILRKELDTKTAYTGITNLATFGMGPHVCLGVQLAIMEMQVASDFVLDYMEEFQFADGGDPGEVGIFTRYPDSLPIRFKAREEN